ncbi:hypothetical protein FVEN_g8314 [Fusarium venenatum]|uniref:Uncharacterized protein n=1 Tax=Fusarium venenatum TaxID=56646 RepID=A0A2L2TEP1_9HYPO|nr:uncharacterized protein FVRRES_03015 [Fusarium venenatum]KAG8353748.1 hypothetical protein FVEN_g8314 [Fusarium venenatum]CEI66503.1 unnamed protein product [Fusarium venenatum]
MTSVTLAPEQVHALFDILTHYETYTEIQGFKSPDAITGYGYPFARKVVEPQTTQSAPPSTGWRSWAGTPANSRPGTPKGKDTKDTKEPVSNDGDDGNKPSTAPILQAMLNRFILKLPGIKDLPREFWSVRVQGLLTRLGEAELSESYDKGAVGTRKVLATGSSGLLEMVSRGVLGGVKQTHPLDKSLDKKAGSKVEYDRTKATDLVKAWNDVVEGLVYGTLADEMFDHFSKTPDVESHSPVIGAAAEYAIIHLATFIHHIFVLSPEGRYLLKLLENIHGLIPYKMIKQTLRMGNAAGMINGMMRLLLAKLSVTSVTNWIGLTANADDGMNLLQRIISLVLSWDAGEFRKSADKVEKAKDRPSDEMLEAIRQYVALSRDEHKTVRNASEEHAQSIITAIFNGSNPTLATQLDDQKHAQCLEYYSALLSVRDREGITTAFCRQPPDLFTATIKDLFAAYEPMIRTVHSQIDLREHMESAQLFIDEFIKTSKPNDSGSLPTVDDYVGLFMRNRELMYRWVHAFAKSCPDVWKEMKSWTQDAVLKFRQERKPVSMAKGEHSGKTSNGTVSMSAMDEKLNKLFQSIPEKTQKDVLNALDNHAAYLAQVEALSLCRLQRLIDSDDSESGNMTGPGMYLSRWQSLLDATPITPASPKGPVRHGKDVKSAITMGKTGVEGTEEGREQALKAAKEEAEEGPEAPNVDVVIGTMADGFREILQET